MIRKLFVACAALGLLINLYGDLQVFRQIESSKKTGEWVNHSYAVSKAIDTVRIATLAAISEKSNAAQIKPSIEKLHRLVGDSPTQVSRVLKLKQLKDDDLLKPTKNSAVGILSEMNREEESLLQLRLRHDAEAVEIESHKIIFCGIADILLIILFSTFFVYEHRKARKAEAALAKSLFDVEASYEKLQRVLLSREIKMRTTVHDLKNPLGSIRGFAEILGDRPTDRDSVTTLANLIQKISNSSLAMVGFLLDEEELEEIPKEHIDVSQLLTETCSWLKPIANEKHQKIVLCKMEGIPFYGAKQPLQNVFVNIIGNALKFSPQGASIEIGYDHFAGFHQVSIADEGPGFTAADFDRLFIRGACLSARPTGTEVSNRIGLFSAKQTVDSFRGRLEVANRPQLGARVTIWIPDIAPASETVVS